MYSAERECRLKISMFAYIQILISDRFTAGDRAKSGVTMVLLLPEESDQPGF